MPSDRSKRPLKVRVKAGKSRSLSEFKGKYVVLEWFNPGCPFVQKHYTSENMQRLQKEFTSKGVAWLTIDSSAPGSQGNLTPEGAKKQMSEWKMSSTALLLDPYFMLDPFLKGFAAAVLGGLNSLPGAVVGGVILGVVESLAGAYLAIEFKRSLAFLVILAVLLIRPEGLLGREFKERV